MKLIEKLRSKKEVRGTATRKQAEDVVDAVGEALGIDTGSISEHRFDLAVQAVLRVLNGHH